MAGAACPGYCIYNPGEVLPSKYTIKSAEVINEGDLVGLNSSGQMVVATHGTGAGAAIIKPIGVAFFNTNNGTGGAQTGDGLTPSATTSGIAKKAYIYGMNTTLCPSLAAGLPVYLGPAPSTTVSNYTCAVPAAGYALIQVGYVDGDGATLVIDVPNVTELQEQSSGNSTVTAS